MLLLLLDCSFLHVEMFAVTRWAAWVLCDCRAFTALPESFSDSSPTEKCRGTRQHCTKQVHVPRTILTLAKWQISFWTCYLGRLSSLLFGNPSKRHNICLLKRDCPLSVWVSGGGVGGGGGCFCHKMAECWGWIKEFDGNPQSFPC